MINVDETRLPSDYEHRQMNPGKTIPPDSETIVVSDIPMLLAGESLDGSYIINSVLSTQGKQATVYLAKKWGKTYVVKVYHNDWKPSAQLRNYLKNVEHPNIARVIDSGEYENQYYEIYDYYSEGTLEQVGMCSSMHLKNIIIPSINEGLNELHKNGIVHCDIKPSNLFYNNNRECVIIGDCGISGFANVNGKLIDSVRGTPEYAPRVKSLLWNAAMSSAYDYGSFGLVLYKLVTGHSLFEGMSIEEISRAWENGIILSNSIEGRMATLIKGLITEDETNRWGYLQVKRWCEGEYMRPVNRSIYSRPKKETRIRPLIFGRFDNQTLSVSSLFQLANAIRKHWEQAKIIIKRRELIEFIQQHDRSLTDKVRELATYQDTDAAVFKLLNLIDNSNSGIFYCGKDYGSIASYINALSTGKDPMAIKFLSSGLFVQYLRELKADRELLDKLEILIKKHGCNDLASICTICHLILGKNGFDINGKQVNSIDSLVEAISSFTTQEISDLLDLDQAKAWLYRMGYEKELDKMAELEVKQ